MPAQQTLISALEAEQLISQLHATKMEDVGDSRFLDQHDAITRLNLQVKRGKKLSQERQSRQAHAYAIYATPHFPHMHSNRHTKMLRRTLTSLYWSSWYRWTSCQCWCKSSSQLRQAPQRLLLGCPYCCHSSRPLRYCCASHHNCCSCHHIRAIRPGRSTHILI